MSTIWSFDLGKGSIGEAIRDPKSNTFLHKESLLIPAEFASIQNAATRRRMWRTRQAHKARQGWLDDVWRGAGLTSLVGRRVEEQNGKWTSVNETPEQQQQRGLLEREFPAKGDATCYTSCLLRIKLLRGENLASWQIYKALHSASQKRGYGRVPWAAQEAKRGGATEEEVDKILAKKDPEYRAAIEVWPKFKQLIENPAYHFPCYYDAWKMGLWSPNQPDRLEERINCRAQSTRNVRFDRTDVDSEVAALGRQAVAQLPALAAAFLRWKRDGWKTAENGALRIKTFVVSAADFGEFLVYGPAGKPVPDALASFAGYLRFRKDPDGKRAEWSKQGFDAIHPGSADDWMGVTGQKTPRFDNRIVNGCALISRLKVCGVGVRFNTKTGTPYPDSILASEVTFLMKLKNTLVSDGAKQRKLTPMEVGEIFKVVTGEAMAIKHDEKNAEQKVVSRYSISKSDWGKTKGIKELGLRPVMNHEEVKPPKPEGRCRLSRPALRLVRALILGGEKPSEFYRSLLARDPNLLAIIGMDVLEAVPARPTQGIEGKKGPRSPGKPHVLFNDLKFLADLARTNDTWEDLYFPEQRLDALEARHSDDAGKVDVCMAVRELLGTINDPVVRHRLSVFSDRLTAHHRNHGMPEEVVLEFVREDFMGEEAKRDLQKFMKEREKARKESKERAAELGVGERSGQLKFELFKLQSGECPYCQQTFAQTELASYRIEHIVPRAQGGPDAMVNYVLAHEACNDAKGEMTPFQWKHGREGWDGYQMWVQRHATALRNKKVQLLLREDARELVERYTALAETAWIAKLAQKITSLHFGWRNGIDFSGAKPTKRVTVISGGLTARIRRKYRLNSLLAPLPSEFVQSQIAKATTAKGSALTAVEVTAVTRETAHEWESIAEKNRGDHRHHALDAMVINFLPQWTRHPDKEHFFRFPEQIHKNSREFFQREIDQVMPRNIAYEKAALAETNYGSRSSTSGEVIVQRVRLRELGLKPIAQGKTKFDGNYLRKNVKDVRDAAIAGAINSFLESEPDEAAWERFCEEYRLPQQNGSPGQRVLRVNVYVGEPDEFVEMSKDGTGSWRKGLGSHKGQIIHWDESGKLVIRPVFAHGSISAERRAVESLGGKARFYGFFQSDCAVETTTEIPAENYSLVVVNEEKQNRRIPANKPLKPCRMTLRNIRTKNRVCEMTLANNTRIVAKLEVWVTAGLIRVK